MEEHAHGGLVHAQRRQRFHIGRITQGVGNVQRIEAGDTDDLTGGRGRGVDTFKAVVAHDGQNFTVAHGAVSTDHFHRAVGLDLATLDPTDTDDAQVAVVIQRGDLHLERAVGVHIRVVHLVDDGLQQRRHVVSQIVCFQASDTVKGGGIDHREVQLLIGGSQVVEQVEHLIHYPVRTGARAVDLVDHHDRLEAGSEGFLGHEAGLGHGAVYRVYQQQYGIHHGHHPLYFTAKVGVSGGVHDVDAVIVPLNSGVLGEDGDATLLLQIVGIHHPLDVASAISQGAGLLQQLVHQGGFAVVNVGDNGNIAQAFNHECWLQ